MLDDFDVMRTMGGRFTEGSIFRIMHLFLATRGFKVKCLDGPVCYKYTFHSTRHKLIDWNYLD